MSHRAVELIKKDVKVAQTKGVTKEEVKLAKDKLLKLMNRLRKKGII